MLKAVDRNNNRISPEKGKLGFCQLCGQNVRAYCGEINIHHWRHVNEQNCDSWNEGETEWHREWKNKFPDEWQEVLIEKNFEKHIADIRTQKNLVLELQNSSISTTTINIRENFYEKMIWLINANNFKENFKIRSLVKSQLRYLDDNHRKFMNYKPEDSTELIQAKDELQEVENDLKNLNCQISDLQSKLKEIVDLLEDFKNTAKKFINYNHLPSRITEDLELSENKELKEIKESIKNLNQELITRKKILTVIDQLENCKIDSYTNFKYIRPDQVKSSSFPICALVEKETETSLFPEILQFRSKQEFEQIAKNQKYRLIINPTEKVKKIKNEINEQQNTMQILSKKKSTMKKKIKSQLKSFLKKSEKYLKEQLCKIERRKIKLNDILISHESRIISIELNDSEKRESELVGSDKEHNKDRYDIMKKYKGLYNYIWKHKRKSWDYSKKKIFLDFENAIFEIISDNQLRKHEKLEFIEIVKNWK